MKKFSLVLAAVVLSASIAFSQDASKSAKGGKTAATNNGDKGGKTTGTTKTDKGAKGKADAKPAAKTDKK